jgi:hypothetical protein
MLFGPRVQRHASLRPRQSESTSRAALKPVRPSLLSPGECPTRTYTTLNRDAVSRPTRDRSLKEKLVESHIAVKDVSPC